MRRLPMMVLCALVLFAGACGSSIALMGTLLKPAHSYHAARAPAPPDYSLTSSWAALPDREDAADLVPPGVEPGDRQAEAAVDVFYVHPTTYYRATSWNAPLEDALCNSFTDTVLAAQASAFNGCCKVYAPRYRQATLASFMEHDENARQSFRLAYLDVAAAFAYYLAYLNQGRPFILASHSQGSMHLMRLLEDLSTSPARARLVAAYVPGYRMPVDKFERSFPGIGPCKGPTDTGCVVAWDSYAETATEQRMMPNPHWYGAALEPSSGKSLHCTNPLTWTTDDAVGAAKLHLGSVRPRFSQPAPGLEALILGAGSWRAELAGLDVSEPGRLSARCSKGKLLITPAADQDFSGKDIGAGSYHLDDYAFFYLSVRENALARVEAFLASP